MTTDPHAPPRRGRRRCALVVVTLSVALLAGGSRAADLAVNAYCPFPIGSPRVLGMAGAFTGIGSGAEAILSNPAAVLRPDGFQLGPTNIDYMLFTARQPEGVMSDFGNVGPDLMGREAATFTGFGIIGRRTGEPLSPHGYGFYLSGQSYYFQDGSGAGTAELGLIAPRIAFGRAWLDEQLLIAVAIDTSTPNFTYTNPDAVGPPEVEVEYQGLGGVPLELGVLWAPEGRRFQVGARVKGRRDTGATSTIASIEPFPDEVVYPGEWSVGVAYRFGERSPEGEGCWFDRATIDFDVRGVFPIAGTAGFERFRSDPPLEVVDDALVQPAFGVELELYTRIAWLWFGSYHEPARYADVDSRIHTTGGLKVRLFKKGKLELYLAAASDVAERFNVWTVSVATSASTF